MAYSVPVDELSIARIEGYREAAKKAALKRAQGLKLATKMEELIFREAAPQTDFGNAAGTVGWATEHYVTGAILVNTWTLVFSTAAVPQLANNKIAVIYKIVDWNVPCRVAAVRFRLGLTGATTLGWFPVEQFINVKMTPEVYLSEPIVYNPSQFLFIECYCSVAVPAAGETLGFGAFIAEPSGEQVS